MSEWYLNRREMQQSKCLTERTTPPFSPSSDYNPTPPARNSCLYNAVTFGLMPSVVYCRRPPEHNCSFDYIRGCDPWRFVGLVSSFSASTEITAALTATDAAEHTQVAEVEVSHANADCRAARRRGGRVLQSFSSDSRSRSAG